MYDTTNDNIWQSGNCIFDLTIDKVSALWYILNIKLIDEIPSSILTDEENPRVAGVVTCPRVFVYSS